jgi:hypothetical protein
MGNSELATPAAAPLSMPKFAGDVIQKRSLRLLRQRTVHHIGIALLKHGQHILHTAIG